MIDLDDGSLNAKVASFVANRDWDWNRLNLVFTPDIIDLLVAMKPPKDLLGEDTVDWLSKPAGRFTVKSAYEAMYGEYNADGQRFKHIW